MARDPMAAVLAPAYVDDVRLELAIEIADAEVAANHCQRERVVVLLAAHMLAMADRAGSGGAVASESEGGVSVSYTAPATDDLLASTAYGQEVIRLNRMCFGMSAMTARSNLIPRGGGGYA